MRYLLEDFGQAKIHASHTFIAPQKGIKTQNNSQNLSSYSVMHVSLQKKLQLLHTKTAPRCMLPEQMVLEL